MSTETTEPDARQGTAPPSNRPRGGPGTSRPNDRPTGLENSAQGADAEGPDGGEGNTEAARYRRKLRDTERERDHLAERVSALQRREIEQVAAEYLQIGADVLRFGDVELSALCDDDGFPDTDKIGEAARAVVATRPGLRRGLTLDRSAIGQGYTPAPPAASRTSWGDALRRRG